MDPAILNALFRYNEELPRASGHTVTFTEKMADLASEVANALRYVSDAASNIASLIGRAFDVIGNKAASTGEKIAAVGSSIAGIAQQLGGSKALVGMLGGAAAGAGTGFMIGGPIGAVVGGVVGGIGGLLGGQAASRAERRQANDQANISMQQQQAELLKVYGSLEAIRQLDAELGTDLTGHWGEQGVAGQRAWQVELDKVNERLARQKQLTDELTDARADLASKEAELKALQEAAKPTWDQVDAIMKKYKIDAKDAGLAIQQMQANAQSKSFLDTLNTWKDAGGDVGALFNGMRTELDTFVTDSLKFGTTIPANMRPLIERMVVGNDLIDASGRKIGTLADLKWGEPVKTEAEIMKEAMDKVALSIQTLVDKIAALLTDIGKIGTETARIPTRPPWADWKNPDLGEEPRPGYTAPPPPAHYGAYVTAHGLQRYHGGGVAGEVPALLQAGEGVLSRGVGMPALGGRDMLRALNTGRARILPFTPGGGGSSSELQSAIAAIHAIATEMKNHTHAIELDGLNLATATARYNPRLTRSRTGRG